MIVTRRPGGESFKTNKEIHKLGVEVCNGLKRAKGSVDYYKRKQNKPYSTRSKTIV